MSVKNTKSIKPVGKRFAIGEIVTLKSNHLRKADHHDHIWLAGDPNFTSPLMVITEITINVNKNIDENSAKDKSERRKCRYKCMFFSNKQLKFEENWFFQEDLLRSKYKVKRKTSIKQGQRVVFKTNQIEVAKRKSFIEQENKKKNRKSSSLLTFSSPVFVVIGFNVVEKKEQELDRITGEVKHEYASKNVKVKFFNSLQDKFSEFIVPIEVLSSAEIANKAALNEIIAGKKNDSVFNFELKDCSIVCVVDTVLFVSDDYLINYTNFFTKEEGAFKLSALMSVDALFKPNDLSLKSYPNVSNPSGTIQFNYKSISDILDELATESEKENKDTTTPLNKEILHLRYQNDSNKYTERYVIPLFVAKNDEPIDAKEPEKKDTMKRQYLKAYCLLRNGDRFFRSDRILSLDVIDDATLFEIACEIWKGPTDSSDLDSDGDE
jgi:hypothetical protein